MKLWEEKVNNFEKSIFQSVYNSNIFTCLLQVHTLRLLSNQFQENYDVPNNNYPTSSIAPANESYEYLVDIISCCLDLRDKNHTCGLNERQLEVCEISNITDDKFQDFLSSSSR